MHTVGEPTVFQNTVTFAGSVFPTWDRTDLTIDQSVEIFIPWTFWRIWDAFHTNLPGTAATDDLALIGGTFGTNAPSIQAGDLKAAGATTRYARACVDVPPEFVTAGTFIIRAHAGMKTTVADTSCTIDFSAYRSDLQDAVGSDLVTTSATTINSLSESDKDFTVDAATLLQGDLLDIRMAITCTDGATGTAVIPFVGGVWLVLDIRG
jgi:hypothetical protein